MKTYKVEMVDHETKEVCDFGFVFFLNKDFYIAPCTPPLSTSAMPHFRVEVDQSELDYRQKVMADLKDIVADLEADE